MNKICRYVFIFALLFISGTLLAQADKKSVVDGYLIIRDTKRATVTVPGGPESIDDYWNSFNIFDEYKHIFNNNANNSEWSAQYDSSIISRKIGRIIKNTVPSGVLPENVCVLIQCVVSLSGRIDMLSYTFKSIVNGEVHYLHQAIPDSVYGQLDKEIKQNVIFPSWKDQVPYKVPVIICFPYKS